MNPFPIITLTTDFGLTDPYVGIMKGVILSINPQVNIIDISHAIGAGNIAGGATVLKEACSWFPEGTIHMGVIDPGVGGDRRPLLIQTRKYFLVGPDNGLFTPFINSDDLISAIHLDQSRFFLPDVSSTFHGRDIFAPVAAHLSAGTDPAEMGTPVKDPVQERMPALNLNKDTLTGEIIHVDHFGNLITNIQKQALDRFLKGKKAGIQIRELKIQGIQHTYSTVKPGTPLALIGSSGVLEISVNMGRACDFLGMAPDQLTGIGVDVTRI